MSKRKPKGYWTLERCMEDAAQYASRSEWRNSSPRAYKAASNNGWLQECCSHMPEGYKPAGYWTLERCMKDAAQYSSRSDWKAAPGGAFNSASKNGWLEQCCEHMELLIDHGKWTLERCIEDAAQYSSRGEWGDAGSSAYATAHRNGWLDQCCAHMQYQLKPKGYWTLERCKSEALKYDCRADWHRGSPASESAAQRLGFVAECCEHMERAGGTDNDVVYIWRDAGSDLHKVGVTSARIGEDRINICRRNNGMDPRIVLMMKVDDARAVESKLLELGTDPELDSSIDGYTEFRRLTDAELGQAVSIAYEAALAA